MRNREETFMNGADVIAEILKREGPNSSPATRAIR
jgi:hypothetical protein